MNSAVKNTSGGVGEGTGKTLLLDIDMARAEVNASLAAKEGSKVLDVPYIEPRYTCLFLEDILSVAVSTAMASIAGTELSKLQAAGVALLSLVVVIFGVVPDPNVSEPVSVHVHGKLVHRRALFLGQSVSQISSAVRPALCCENFPPLIRIGCSFVSILAGLGLLVDPLVHRRLVRQIMPADLLQDPSFSISSSPPTQSPLNERANRRSATTSEERFHRLATIAHLILLSRGGDELDLMTFPTIPSLLLLESTALADSTANGLWNALKQNINIIRPSWRDCCVDAVRLKQGSGQWPSLPQPAKEVGLSYPHTNQTEMLRCSINFLWPAMAAAFAMTSRLSKDVSCLIILSLDLCHFPRFDWLTIY